MNPFRLLPLLIIFLLLNAVGRADAKVPALKAVQFQQYRLPNGLRVILSPDHSLPVASVCVIYDVGARNETIGHTGLANLFEHLMFEGSAHVQSGQHSQLIQCAGGYSDSMTHADYTKYYEEFPREQLKLALFLEADRMFSLRLTEDNFSKAREIVNAERREKHDLNAYDSTLVKLQQMAFTNFANSHSVIGTSEDLEKATFEDAKRFHATYYTPSNAVLAVTGDFDPAQIKTLIAQYFASKGLPSAPPPRVDNAEPMDSPIPPEKQQAELRLTRNALPYYYLAFRIPPESHPDFPAIVILSDILGDGNISRCGKRLVESGMATQENVRSYGRRGPTLLVFSA
jgi:zinc protease